MPAVNDRPELRGTEVEILIDLQQHHGLWTFLSRSWRIGNMLIQLQARSIVTPGSTLAPMTETMPTMNDQKKHHSRPSVVPSSPTSSHSPRAVYSRCLHHLHRH